jgi:hypothetical protein
LPIQLKIKLYENFLVDFLANWCFWQSMFLTVDVFDSQCFRAKSWCFWSRCLKSWCFRSLTNGATRIWSLWDKDKLTTTSEWLSQAIELKRTQGMK